MGSRLISSCLLIAILYIGLSQGQTFATFDGSAYAFYDSSGNRVIRSENNNIAFRIRTFSTDGIILMANGTDNYLILELKSGYIRLRIRFRHMTTSEYIIDNGVKISDNAWHVVGFSRSKHFGTLTVDGVKSPHDRRSGLSGLDEIIIDDFIYIGGRGRNNETTVGNSAIASNYSGCLQDVVYNGNAILSNAFRGLPFYGLVGSVIRACTTTPPFIASQLQSRFSRLATTWSPTGFDYTFDFWFRTTDSGRNRELVYVQATYSVVISLTSGIATMLQVGTTDTHVFSGKLNDGSWHQFRLIASSSSFRVYIDNDFGSVAFERVLSSRPTPQITIGSRNAEGFIGCVRGIRIDGIARDVNSATFTRNNIAYNSCPIQSFCQPFFPCYNNATCVSNPGSFACVCGANSNYEGTYCQSYKYRRNCQEVFIFNPTAQTGYYTIDPDGPQGPSRPFPTRCSTADQAATEISNNVERETVVNTIHRNVGAGRFSAGLRYLDGGSQPLTNVSIAQGSALADNSVSCSQRVLYRCQRAVLLNTPDTPYGWWVSRNNMKMVSWGGAPTDSGKCACGVTNTCFNRTKMCNCDSNENRVLVDSGTITDKRYLPIKELRFGFQTADSNRIALFSVGKLICRGQATPTHIITFTTSESRIELPDWQSSFQGIIEIAYKSSISSGTLLKNVGRTGDFLELAVRRTSVSLHYDLGQGSGNTTLTVNSAANTRFDDDQWHRVRLFFSPSRVSLRVDSIPEVRRDFQQLHQVARLDIDGPLFVGYNPQRPEDGFIGCVGDLYIGERLQHLDSFAAAFKGVRNDCGTACLFRPCQHNTVCTGNYSDFHCNCDNTNWIGQRCEAPKGAYFSGGNVIEYRATGMLPVLPNSREDISFTVTTNASNCRIIRVQTRSGQQMEFGLSNGRGYLSVVNDRLQLQTILNDEKLHKITINLPDNTITIDGISYLVRTNTALSVVNIPTVLIGSTSNDRSVSMCINDVSFVGIRIMNMAFNTPRNNTITFIRNAVNVFPTAGVCYGGNYAFTATPTPSVRSRSPSRLPPVIPSVGAQANVTPGGIAGIILFLGIVIGVIVALYIRSSKQDVGKYTTEEAKVDAHQATVEFKSIGPDIVNGHKELHV